MSHKVFLPSETRIGSRQSISGFSLVEMLVVISIVGVLLALLLPTLSEARYKARELQCATNLKFLMLGSLAYSNDNKGQVPDGGFVGYGRGCFDSDTRKVLYENYGLNTPKQWWCPLAYFIKDSAVLKSFNAGQNPKWFTDPNWAVGLNWIENHRGQQGYDYFIGTDRGLSSATYKMPVYLRFDNVRAPSTRQVWIDNLKPPGTTGTQYGGVSGVWQHPCNTHDRGRAGFPDGSFNAMVDGHVEWRKWYEGVNTAEYIDQWFSY